MLLLWGIWVLTPALSTPLLARKLPSPRLTVFSVEQTIAISSRQLGAFCSSRGSSKRDVTLSISAVIEGRVVTNGAVTWVGTAWHAKLPSLGFVLNSTGFKSGLAPSSLFNLALMSVCDLDISAKVELVCPCVNLCCASVQLRF